MAAASETIPCQEIQAAPQPGEPVAAVPEGKNRLQKRFDKLTRRNHELAEAAESWQSRYNAAVQHANRLAAENAKLASALDRALAVGERLQRTRPIIPHPDRYQKGRK